MNERTGSGGPPAVGIIMGSDSDWKTMRPAARVLRELGVSYETKVVSAHRTPKYLYRYAIEAEDRGLSLIIAGAGGAAHLPGMAASLTILPVVGVPVVATPLNGLDALLSIMQMPAEVGVATVGIGPTGAERAALFAVAALALRGPRLRPLLAPVNRAMPSSGVATSATIDKVAMLVEDEADLPTLNHAEPYLVRLGVRHEKVVVPRATSSDGLARRVAELESSGSTVFIAGSSRGIQFACEVAQATTHPVLAVPIVTEKITCVDEFLRPFLDMPPRVATFAVGRPGAINAALFAATIISERGSDVWKNFQQIRDEQTERVLNMKIEDSLASEVP